MAGRKMSEEFRKGLAARLGAARERVGMVQKEVARALGVSTSTVGGWEIGQGGPSLEDLVTLTKLTGRSCDWFLGLPERSEWSSDEAALINLYRQLPREETRREILNYVGQMAARYRKLAEQNHEASS